MKSNWSIEKIIISLALIAFSVGFFLNKQFIISFFTIGLLIVFTRFSDLKNLIIGSKGLTAEFIEKDKELSRIIKSDATSKERLEKSQKLIDEIFKVGYVAGGGDKFINISDVHVERDKNGNVKRYEYNEQ